MVQDELCPTMSAELPAVGWSANSLDELKRVMNAVRLPYRITDTGWWLRRAAGTIRKAFRRNTC